MMGDKTKEIEVTIEGLIDLEAVGERKLGYQDMYTVFATSL